MESTNARFGVTRRRDGTTESEVPTTDSPDRDVPSLPSSPLSPSGGSGLTQLTQQLLILLLSGSPDERTRRPVLRGYSDAEQRTAVDLSQSVFLEGE
jgi:hypothetical protein